MNQHDTGAELNVNISLNLKHIFEKVKRQYLFSRVADVCVFVQVKGKRKGDNKGKIILNNIQQL